MANHIHVHIHRAPTRDRAPVARAVRSIGRDQHAPEDVSQLVAVLMQSIAEQGGKTQDAEFDESKHKRDEGGRFSSTQHAAAAEEHMKAAGEHKKAGNKEAAHAHEIAAGHHTLASQTGKALHAEMAHSATKEALGASKAKSVAQRRLGINKKYNAQIDAVVKKHQQAAAAAGIPNLKVDAGSREDKLEIMALRDHDKEHYKAHKAVRAELEPIYDNWRQELAAAKAAQGKTAAHHKAEAAKVDEAYAISAHERQSSPAQGEKPTSTTAKGARAATHELLSSGHPFSVDELCKATGAPKSTITTVLSAFKNPKYAGKLGTLEIVKRPDGMYHVQKKEGSATTAKPGHSWGSHEKITAALNSSPTAGSGSREAARGGPGK